MFYFIFVQLGKLEGQSNTTTYFWMTTDPWRSESQVEKSPPDSKNFHVILHLPHFYFSSPFMGYRRECKDTQICREKGEREEINGYSVSGWWITHGLPQKREREPKRYPHSKNGSYQHHCCLCRYFAFSNQTDMLHYTHNLPKSVL